MSGIKPAKIANARQRMNEAYYDEVYRVMLAKFDIEVETIFDLTSFATITMREDGQDFTKEQADFMASFEMGWLAATAYVFKEG